MVTTLTVRGWIAVGVVALVLSGVGAGCAYLRHLQAADQRAALATDDAAGRKLEIKGAELAGNAAATAAQAAGELRNDAAILDAQAHADPAARAPLDAGAIERLHAGDRQLCGAGSVACR